MWFVYMAHPAWVMTYWTWPAAIGMAVWLDAMTIRKDAAR